MPLLSVIIPTYNRSALLAGAIDSVLSQEFTDFELMVVDDGSTDDTPALLERYTAALPPEKMRVFRQANAGQGAARNLAIAQARGEYCSFLDSDDLFFPWTLATVAAVINDNGRPSVVAGVDKSFGTSEQFRAIPREPLRVSPFPDVYAYGRKNLYGPCGIMVARTELLREVGGFLTDRIVGEDADLMMRLGVVPNVVKIHSPGMYGYRVHEDNFTASHERWHRGARLAIARFRNGVFPGGRARAADVRKYVIDVVEYYSFICLYFGGRRNCLDLYLRTLPTNVRAGNFRFLFRTAWLMALSGLGLWPGKRVHIQSHRLTQPQTDGNG